MNKKIITGAVITLAAGLAAYIYNRKRNKIDSAAKDAYDTIDHFINRTERQTENIFS